MKKLKQAHEKVKNHPFRLGDKKQWESYHKLLGDLDEEFSDILEGKFKEYNGWGFFIHELRSAIWHFDFEFREERTEGKCGRASLSGDGYGKIIPEYQSKIIIILENYIQQIHNFIKTNEFNGFTTYYFGGKNCMNEIQSDGESRWSKFELNKEGTKFEFKEKLK